MTSLVYHQPARKSPTPVTQELRQQVLDGLRRASQQQLARELGISQSLVSKIAREVPSGCE